MSFLLRISKDRIKDEGSHSVISLLSEWKEIQTVMIRYHTRRVSLKCIVRDDSA